MSLIDKLPTEIYNYILWLSVGATDLEIYKKKKNLSEEIINNKNLRESSEGQHGFYLFSIKNYDKTPELIPMHSEYVFALRIPWRNYYGYGRDGIRDIYQSFTGESKRRGAEWWQRKRKNKPV